MATARQEVDMTMQQALGAALMVVVMFASAADTGARAGEATVAVATNFKTVADKLVAEVAAARRHDIRLVSGSTGKLAAQIMQGAPFDAFLAADTDRPARLVESGHAVRGSRFTYAVGRLALWSPDPARVGPEGLSGLNTQAVGRLAIANPELAPYGLAARQALAHYGLWAALRPRIVMGQNIGQAYALVASGNAPLGLVALSQVMGGAASPGAEWIVPQAAHAPIRQDAVLLAAGADNAAARAFLRYLRSAKAAGTIADFGYAGG